MSRTPLDLHEPIAIVGMGCHFPDAPNPESYWRNISENRCHIRNVTEDYTGLPPVYDPNPEAWNKTHSNLAAIVDPIEFPFKRFRGLPPSAIQAADYHFRYTLLAAQESIDNAKLPEQPQYHARTFVAFANNAYETPMLRDYANSGLFYRLEEFSSTPTFQNLSENMQQEVLNKIKKDYFRSTEKLSIDALTASMAGSLASRIMKTNGFSGGHVAVDSACASSFAAVDLAIKKIRSGVSDVSIAGGIGGILPFFYIYCSKAKTMSALGSFPFDTRASGFVVGEGAGFVVLKRLTTALRDGDHIHAIIRGIGASSDGSKTAPWAPNKEGQKLSYARAFKQVPYTIRDIQYIECHGTGTQVGDVEELQGIQEVIGQGFDKQIAIGSAKAAVGHLLTGAGMAGLFRTLLAIQNKKLPPTANVENLIPELKKPDYPLYVPRSLTHWDLPVGSHVRRAMVNSFGFGGTNYNLQVEEFNTDFHGSYPAQEAKSVAPQSPSKSHFRPHILKRLPVSEITIEEADQIYNIPIAITAISLRVPGANTPQEFVKNLKEGRSFISTPPANRWDENQFFSKNTEEKWKTITTRGGFVDLPSPREKLRWKIPPIVLEHLDPNQFRLFVTVEEALKKSKLLEIPEVLENTAMICGNMMDSDFLFDEHKSVRFHFFADFIRKNFPALNSSQKENLISEFFERIKTSLHTFNADNSTSGIDSMLASRVAKFFDLKGGSMSLDSVCATGILALDHACKALRSREIEAAVVCTSNMGMSGALFCMYQDLTALSRTNEIRPFDRARDGMLLGEGSVAFVLRRLPDAIKDGSEIVALIHATSTSSDGTSPQMLAPVKSTVKLAFEEALSELHGDTPPVESIECHGSGTSIGDQIEMECCHEVYGKSQNQSPSGAHSPVTLGSVKSSIGHLKVASAFASVAKTALSLKERAIFPTPNHTNPDPFLLEHAASICVLKDAPKSFVQKTPFAAVNAMGLGGINGHAILSAYDESQWKYKSTNDGSVFFESEPLDIHYKIHFKNKLSATQKKLIQNKFNPQIADLLRKEGVYFVDSRLSGQGKIAFLFPGQSSAYSGMYRALSQENSYLRQFLNQADQFCEKNSKKPLSSILYDPSHADLISDLFYSQVAPYTFQVALSSHLKETMGILPDLLIGHSVGEFAALATANVIDFETGLNILFTRYQVVKQLVDAGQPEARMLVLRANEVDVRKLIAGLPNISIANVNTVDQTVVSGFSTSIAKARDRALTHNIDTKELAIAQAFHSPILTPAVGPFLERLKKVTFNTPEAPLTSLVTEEIYVKADQIPELLAHALTAPVYFERLVNLAHVSGIRHFIDLGPGWPLKNMVEKILGGTTVNSTSITQKSFKTFYLNHPKEKDPECLKRFEEEFPLWQKIQEKKAPQITGNAFERGEKMGRLWKERYTDYSWVWDRFPEEIKNNYDSAIQNLNLFISPDEKEEIRGIASGAEVTESTVNLINSLSSIATSRYGLCSGFVSKTKTDTLLHGANFDFPFVTAQDFERLPRAVLEVHTPGKYPYLGVFKLGSPYPLCGMNSEGLSISLAAASPTGTLTSGINIHAMTRGMLENSGTLKELELFCEGKSLEGAWIFLISSKKDNQAIRLEWSGSKRVLAENFLYHANHFQNFQDGLPIREDSLFRLSRLKSLYNKGIFTPRQAFSVLGDGFDTERGRTPKFPTKNTLNRYNTSISVVFDPAETSLIAAYENIPSGCGPYYRYRFTEVVNSPSVGPASDLPILLSTKTHRWVNRMGHRIDPGTRPELSKVPGSLPPNTVLLTDSKNNFSSLNPKLNPNLRVISLDETLTLHEIQTPPSLLIDLTCIKNTDSDFITATYDGFLKKCRLIKDFFSRGLIPERIFCSGSLTEPVSLQAVASHAFYQSLQTETDGLSYCFLNSDPKTSLEKRLETLPTISTSNSHQLLYLSGKDLYSSRQVLAPLRSTHRKGLPTKGDTFLITGGAGGITAEIGIALSKQYPGTFILLGRSQISNIPELKNKNEFLVHARKTRPGLKPVDYLALWEQDQRSRATQKNIKRYLESGSEAYYYSVDLRDLIMTKEIIQNIIETHGPIQHLIHGAGTQRSKLFIEKTEKEFESIFSTKTINTSNLLASLKDQPLKSAYFFSSISGVSGNIGQTDYSATNAVLSASGELIQKSLPNECTTRIINWPAWGETGMAMDSAVHSDMKKAGIEFLSIQDGVRFFMNEFHFESHDFSTTCTPATSLTKSDASSAGKNFQNSSERDFIQAKSTSLRELPYIDEINQCNSDQIVFEKYFSGLEQFLQDHLVHGVPTLPGVILTEAVLEGASLLEPDLNQASIHSIRFIHACTINPKIGNRVRITFQKLKMDSKETGTQYHFKITTPKRRSDGVVLLQEFIHCEGELLLSDEPHPFSLTSPFSFPEIWKKDFRSAKPLIETTDFYKKLLSKFPEGLGKSFHTVQAILKKDAHGILVRGTHSEGDAFGRGRFICHASVFDIMNHSVIEFLDDEAGILQYLPFEFNGLRIIKSFNPGDGCFLHLSSFEKLNDRILFRAAFFDQDLNLCMSVDQVTHRKYH